DYPPAPPTTVIADCGLRIADWIADSAIGKSNLQSAVRNPQYEGSSGASPASGLAWSTSFEPSPPCRRRYGGDGRPPSPERSDVIDRVRSRIKSQQEAHMRVLAALCVFALLSP